MTGRKTTVVPDVEYHSDDSIDSVEWPAVLLFALPMAFFLIHKII